MAAVVHDADGNPLDQIQETFTVDTTAPEAGIQITAGDTNAAVYWNASEGAYIATARNPGAALLNITGTPKFANVGAGEGYLFYQEVGLDAGGMPTTTWMPLTVENTMLSSGIWQALLERQGEDIVKVVKGQFPQLVGGLDDASILGLLRSFTPMTLVETMISAADIQNAANSFFKSLGLQNFNFTPAQAEAIHQALGVSIDLVDHLVPVTFESPHTMVMPIEGNIWRLRHSGNGD